MTTPSLFRSVLSFVAGLAMAGFGLLRSITTYPGQDAFTRFATALPTVTAVASFALAVLAALAGLLLLLPTLLRLRRHQPRQPQPVTLPASRSDYGVRVPPLRPLPLRQEADPNHEPEEEEHTLVDYMAGTGSGYGGAYDDGSTVRRHNNGDDARRWNGPRR